MVTGSPPLATLCRELSNVFEWSTHLPLAEAAGVPVAALAALQAGQPLPAGLRRDLALARSVTGELVGQHRLREDTYATAVDEWGEPGLVELLTLVGYFAMVCWLMNVARTPGPTA